MRKGIQILLVLVGLGALGVSIKYAIKFLSVSGASVAEWASAAFVILMGLAALLGAIQLARKIRAKAA
jgi:predicted membrane channel-forming protein YqfA (hemolysin III family)